MGRVLISLTTIPPRFGGIVRVLETLLVQGADGVVLAVPHHWARFPGHWRLPPLPQGIEVLRCDDLGPASKVLPLRAAEPDAEIIYCDDDCLYGPGWLDALRRGPGVRAGSTFDIARLRRKGGRVAQGFAGVRVPPSIPLTEDVPARVRWADDLWLSAWIEAQGHTVTTVPEAHEKVTPLSASASLQDRDRAAVYARAAEDIHRRLGLWPPL